MVNHNVLLSLTAHKGKSKKSKGRKKTPGKKHPPAAPLTVTPIQDTLFILTRSLDDQQCKDNHFTLKVSSCVCVCGSPWSLDSCIYNHAIHSFYSFGNVCER